MPLTLHATRGTSRRFALGIVPAPLRFLLQAWIAVFESMSDSRERLSTLAHLWNQCELQDRCEGRVRPGLCEAMWGRDGGRLALAWPWRRRCHRCCCVGMCNNALPPSDHCVPDTVYFFSFVFSHKESPPPPRTCFFLEHPPPAPPLPPTCFCLDNPSPPLPPPPA